MSRHSTVSPLPAMYIFPSSSKNSTSFSRPSSRSSSSFPPLPTGSSHSSATPGHGSTPLWCPPPKAVVTECAFVFALSLDRQWPKVHDSCHTFLHVALQFSHGRVFSDSRNVKKKRNSRMSVCFLTRATCKNVRQNLIPRATAYSAT